MGKYILEVDIESDLEANGILASQANGERGAAAGEIGGGGVYCSELLELLGQIHELAGAASSSPIPPQYD